MPLLLALQQSPTLATGIVATVNRFTDFLLGYVVALAAVGALSMAVIEAIKKFRDSRTKFHALRWTQWMTRSEFARNLAPALQSSEPKRGSGSADETPTTELALRDLLQLCTGISRDEALAAARRLIEKKGHLPFFHAFSPSPAHALFALDLPRMMGSIQDAADVALATPAANRSLYFFMTSGADPNDVSSWYAESARFGSTSAVADTDAARQHVKEQAERFARLRQIVKRRLDGFQIYTGDRWASWNQFAANVFGAIVMFTVLVWLRMSSDTGLPNTATIIVFSLFGGILSPVAKDLVSALKRVKDG